MTDDSLPEPDRVPGCPHPRETVRLIGQEAAEAAFLAALAEGRPHHAWLLTGPEGIGKATFAWRAARHLLAAPQGGGGGLFGDEAPAAPATLDIETDHPVSRRMRALSEPRLCLVRRGPTDDGKRLSAEIRVDEIRRMRDFLHMSATDGGRRAVIIDAADEMNTSAANALLKHLEEPPAGVTFLIVSHRPSALLPTIRSRCRVLALSPLAPGALAEALTAAGLPGDVPGLSELAGGSVGAAARLIQGEGAELYAELLSVVAGMPRLDRPAAIALADSLGRRADDLRTGLAFAMIDTLLARLARRGATGRDAPDAASGEAAILARLSPDPAAARAWSDLAGLLGPRLRHGRAVNLDPGTLLLDTLVKLSETAGRLALG
jgi:DNA polymerase-3 subunit delta'